VGFYLIVTASGVNGNMQIVSILYRQQPEMHTGRPVSAKEVPANSGRLNYEFLKNTLHEIKPPYRP